MKKLVSFFFGLLLMLGAALSYAEPIDINTADAETLAQTIKGVGPVRAQAIIAYRTEHGPFRSISELTNVKGIGMKLVENNRDNIMVAKQKVTETKVKPKKE